MQKVTLEPLGFTDKGSTEMPRDKWTFLLLLLGLVGLNQLCPRLGLQAFDDQLHIFSKVPAHADLDFNDHLYVCPLARGRKCCFLIFLLTHWTERHPISSVENWVRGRGDTHQIGSCRIKLQNKAVGVHCFGRSQPPKACPQGFSNERCLGWK